MLSGPDASVPADANAVTATGAHVSGAHRWLLLGSLTTVFFVLLALYCAVLSVLLPNQIQAIDPANKARDLAIVFAITSIFSTLTTPIAGALSDRTRSRWGRRTPWIAIGAVTGALCLFAASQMRNLWSITFFWVGATVALNSMQAALTTIVADRFPEHERGTVSGFVGAGMTAGGTIGIVVAGYMASTLTIAYLLFAVAIAVVCVAFVMLNPEPRFNGAAPGPMQLGAFFKSFWISPRQHPDFAWAFCGRFAIYMGYQGIVTYLLYILQDYIGLSLDNANRMIATLSTVTFIALVIAGLGSGLLSDAIGRRKPLVFLSSIVMGIALTVPLIFDTVPGMLWYAALMGIGYGAFMSVDMALMTQVLPKSLTGAGSESTGKDLGILTSAVNVPQILSPVWCAWLLNLSGNDYQWLFVSAMVFVFAGSFFVLPIKSVR
ncbi:MAG TPA: MFS transporter [Steroidobacter sp.]|uniref:MFS transporter n=1 Tax=Steroidobacter sp. TaxID=1978227 RepID=UPI002ED8B3A7